MSVPCDKTMAIMEFVILRGICVAQNILYDDFVYEFLMFIRKFVDFYDQNADY
jgi:hypothetical protein